MYVSFCPELDIASQGDTVDEARGNFQEALSLFFQEADPKEVARRLRQTLPIWTLSSLIVADVRPSNRTPNVPFS